MLWFGPFIGWWEFYWHHSSPGLQENFLVSFSSEVDQAEVHFLLVTDRETITSPWFFSAYFVMKMWARLF